MRSSMLRGRSHDPLTRDLTRHVGERDLGERTVHLGFPAGTVVTIDGTLGGKLAVVRASGDGTASLTPARGF